MEVKKKACVFAFAMQSFAHVLCNSSLITFFFSASRQKTDLFMPLAVSVSHTTLILQGSQALPMHKSVQQDSERDRPPRKPHQVSVKNYCIYRTLFLFLFPTLFPLLCHRCPSALLTCKSFPSQDKNKEQN